MIQIKLNGEAYSLESETSLENLLKQNHLSQDEKGIAIALNDSVVPRAAWHQTIISAGASVEIVHAVQGG